MGKKIYLIGKKTVTGPLYMSYTFDKKIAKRFKKERKGFEVIKLDAEDISEDQLRGEEIINYSSVSDNILLESEEEIIVDGYYEFINELPNTIHKFKKLMKYLKYNKSEIYPLIDELNYIYNTLRYDDMNGDLEEYISMDKFSKFYIKNFID